MFNLETEIKNITKMLMDEGGASSAHVLFDQVNNIAFARHGIISYTYDFFLEHLQEMAKNKELMLVEIEETGKKSKFYIVLSKNTTKISLIKGDNNAIYST